MEEAQRGMKLFKDKNYDLENNPEFSRLADTFMWASWFLNYHPSLHEDLPMGRLSQIANKLDKKGFTKAADKIDIFIKRNF